MYKNANKWKADTLAKISGNLTGLYSSPKDAISSWSMLFASKHILDISPAINGY